MSQHHQKPKITNTHSTMIDVAEIVVRECILKDIYTTRVTLGVIEKTNQSARGKFRIKFVDISGALLLRIRGNLFVQDVRVYSDNIAETKNIIAAFALKKGYIVN